MCHLSIQMSLNHWRFEQLSLLFFSFLEKCGMAIKKKGKRKTSETPQRTGAPDKNEGGNVFSTNGKARTHVRQVQNGRRSIEIEDSRTEWTGKRKIWRNTKQTVDVTGVIKTRNRKSTRTPKSKLIKTRTGQNKNLKLKSFTKYCAHPFLSIWFYAPRVQSFLELWLHKKKKRMAISYTHLGWWCNYRFRRKRRRNYCNVIVNSKMRRKGNRSHFLSVLFTLWWHVHNSLCRFLFLSFFLFKYLFMALSITKDLPYKKFFFFRFFFETLTEKKKTNKCRERFRGCCWHIRGCNFVEKRKLSFLT